MSEIYTVTGNKFIVIIDEWDILIRDEANNRDEQENYINFLRGMFKGTEPTRFISLAYLTGILPIKKMKTQSALNNFDEFTMLDAGALASYIGFTELEVEKLCDKYHKDFAEVKDGMMDTCWKISRFIIRRQLSVSCCAEISKATGRRPEHMRLWFH